MDVYQTLTTWVIVNQTLTSCAIVSQTITIWAIVSQIPNKLSLSVKPSHAVPLSVKPSQSGSLSVKSLTSCVNVSQIPNKRCHCQSNPHNLGHCQSNSHNLGHCHFWSNLHNLGHCQSNSHNLGHCQSNPHNLCLSVKSLTSSTTWVTVSQNPSQPVSPHLTISWNQIYDNTETMGYKVKYISLYHLPILKDTMWWTCLKWWMLDIHRCTSNYLSLCPCLGKWWQQPKILISCWIVFREIKFGISNKSSETQQIIVKVQKY